MHIPPHGGENPGSFADLITGEMRAASVYSLIVTVKMNGLAPRAWPHSYRWLQLRLTPAYGLILTSFCAGVARRHRRSLLSGMTTHVTEINDSAIVIEVAKTSVKTQTARNGDCCWPEGPLWLATAILSRCREIISVLCPGPNATSQETSEILFVTSTPLSQRALRSRPVRYLVVREEWLSD